MSSPSPHPPSPMPPPQAPSPMVVQQQQQPPQQPPIPTTRVPSPLGSSQHHSQNPISSLPGNSVPCTTNAIPPINTSNNQFSAVNSQLNGSPGPMSIGQNPPLSDCPPHQHPAPTVSQPSVQVNLFLFYIFY